MQSKLHAALQTLAHPRPHRWGWIDIGIMLSWIAIVCLQIVHHAMWRDEVRALSIALAGDNLLTMLRGLHGEGHPALWYLLLRWTHDVFGHVAVLPGIAFVISATSVALLIFRSPFPRAIIILIVGSHCFLFEFSVMARNYGISALLLFMIAASYHSARDRGILLGCLLFLLANSNVVATIMVGAFLLFWLLDLVETTGMRWTPQLKNFILNASIATVGVIVCGITILPTYNDAATRDLSATSPMMAVLRALVNPAGTIAFPLTADLSKYFDTIPHSFGGRVLNVLGSILLYGITLGLMPKRAAAFAAITGLAFWSLFSGLAAGGGYRHAMVWLSFCITLYWICWKEVANSVNDLSKTPAQTACFNTGRLMFLTVLALNFVAGLSDVRAAVFGRQVESRSAELGRLISARPDLTEAVIVSEPETMAEALPYYVPNRIFLVREHRFGNVPHFSRSGKLDTNLGEIMQVSRELLQTTSSPVIIILSHRLGNIVPDHPYQEGYNWIFQASSNQILEFLFSTELIASFGPAETNETYDVYLLK